MTLKKLKAPGSSPVGLRRPDVEGHYMSNPTAIAKRKAEERAKEEAAKKKTAPTMIDRPINKSSQNTPRMASTTISDVNKRKKKSV